MPLITCIASPTPNSVGDSSQPPWGLSPRWFTSMIMLQNSHKCHKANKTYQYGVPLKELHLCTADLPWDETPKSAVTLTNLVINKHISKISMCWFSHRHSPSPLGGHAMVSSVAPCCIRPNYGARPTMHCEWGWLRGFSFFVPEDLDLWLWPWNSGEIFVQCT